MVESQNNAHNVLKLWFNVLKSRKYTYIFQQEHQKNLIQLYRVDKGDFSKTSQNMQQ
jgi:hypothetical protein